MLYPYFSEIILMFCSRVNIRGLSNTAFGGIGSPDEYFSLSGSALLCTFSTDILLLRNGTFFMFSSDALVLPREKSLVLIFRLSRKLIRA
jgi:hypothetical protein